ncbi:unnamed protein product [Lepeophtheirus salmonis]|uniref:(salmon louse) hypothetical protein n=1 Tax=Lepeophtheirus salmonis TaxID=72036 RepID=A0A7R8CWG6_LEPSM|nr:unnamed protein product [Lepeophtheirus salmonis]CAF2953156.1 unnamed protein product [Lepeophtheirus salmonis]
MTYSVELFCCVLFGLICGHAFFNVNSGIISESIDPCCAGGVENNYQREGISSGNSYQFNRAPCEEIGGTSINVTTNSDDDAGSLQKQLLFMRCAFESRHQEIDIYPFPGLKIINIRGSALLPLDLIVITHFVSNLSDNNRLLELSLRDYPIEEAGLCIILPCLPLIRTVTFCARKLKLWLLEIPHPCGFDDYEEPDDSLGVALKHLRDVCRQNSVKINI